MSKDTIRSIVFYRLRFIFGYTLVATCLLAVLICAALYVPGGLSAEERASAVISGAIDFSNLTTLLVADAPYHLLQYASIEGLGVSVLSIKLPSVIIALCTILAITLLLKDWFHKNVSVIVAAIAFTTAQFIYLGQLGTPDIMHVFWPALLILVATRFIRGGGRLRWILFGIIVASLSLFTPLMVYVLAIMSLAGVFHPHVRFVVRKMSRAGVATIVTVALVAFAGFVGSAIVSPGLLTTITAYDGMSINAIVHNATQTATQLVDVTRAGGEDTAVIIPLLGFAILALALVGIVTVIKDRHQPHAYVALSLLVAGILTSFLLPGHGAVLFLPIVVLAAAGVRTILDYWYDLFPKNPYARLFALVPLSILVVSLLVSGASRYFYGTHYGGSIATKFDNDIELLEQTLARTNPPSVVAVSAHDLAFYQLYKAASNSQFTLTTDAKAATSAEYGGATIIALRNSDIVRGDARPLGVVASSMAEIGDRLYLYKNTAE